MSDTEPNFSFRGYTDKQLINDYLERAWYILNDEELCLIAKQLYERQKLQDKKDIKKQSDEYVREYLEQSMRFKYGENHGGDISKAKLVEGLPEWHWTVL